MIIKPGRFVEKNLKAAQGTRVGIIPNLTENFETMIEAVPKYGRDGHLGEES
jgi:hypothetical protein